MQYIVLGIFLIKFYCIFNQLFINKIQILLIFLNQYLYIYLTFSGGLNDRQMCI